MVNDKRKCLGCGKEVPKKLREKLTEDGWMFFELRGGGNVQYLSNCGCMTFNEFVDKCHIIHNDEDDNMRREPLVK